MLLGPVVPAEISFSLLPLSWRFAAEHRVRVAIVADRDHFARIPDCPPPRLKILRGDDRALRIALPLAD